MGGFLSKILEQVAANLLSAISFVIPALQIPA